MTKEDFNAGMLILEGGFQKRFSENTFKVWWVELLPEDGSAFIRVCRAMIGDVDAKCSFGEVRARLHGFEGSSGITVGHNPARPYGTHGFPRFHRKNLLRFGNLAGFAKCCLECAEEVKGRLAKPAEAK